MSTLFPNSIDTKINPVAGGQVPTTTPVDPTYGSGHAAEHIFANDAIKAVEAKVGVDGSAVTTSHDYKLGLISGANQAASKAYVDAQVIAGGVNASSTLKGISFLTSDPSVPTTPTALNGEEVSATPGNNKVVRADGSGKLAAGWGGSASGLATLDGSSTVVQNPANATSTSTASKIPIADGSGKLNTWIDTTTLSLPRLQYNFPQAGESISAGNAVAVDDGSTTVTLNPTIGGAGYITAFGSQANWYGQTFLSVAGANRIISITMGLGSSTSTDFTLSVRATSGGTPTGSDLGSASVTGVTSGSEQDVVFTFGTPITVSPNTTYAFIVRQTNNSNGRFNEVDGTYANGTKYESTDSGTTWFNLSRNLSRLSATSFNVVFGTTVAGYLYNADNTGSRKTLGFIGFATQTVTYGQSCIVNISGFDNNQAGLTAGTLYYLSGTPGVLATSGTYKVAIGLSSTTLLIKQL